MFSCCRNASTHKRIFKIIFFEMIFNIRFVCTKYQYWLYSHSGQGCHAERHKLLQSYFFEFTQRQYVSPPWLLLLWCAGWGKLYSQVVTIYFRQKCSTTHNISVTGVESVPSLSKLFLSLSTWPFGVNAWIIIMIIIRFPLKEIWLSMCQKQFLASQNCFIVCQHTPKGYNKQDLAYAQSFIYLIM